MSDFVAPHVMWSIRESIATQPIERVSAAAEGFMAMSNPVDPADAHFVVIDRGQAVFWTDNPTDAFIVQRARRNDTHAHLASQIIVRSLGDAL